MWVRYSVDVYGVCIEFQSCAQFLVIEHDLALRVAAQNPLFALREPIRSIASRIIVDVSSGVPLKNAHRRHRRRTSL
jgi:hypothetical protein